MVLTYGYPDVLGGTLTFQLLGSGVVLIYNFTAFGFSYKGKVDLFTL